MIVCLYLSLFVISLTMVSVLCLTRKKIDYIYMLVFVSITVSNGAYYALSIAKNLEVAILALKFAYFGGILCRYFSLVSSAQILKVEVNKIFRIVLLLFSLFNIALCFSIGRNDIFYASTSIATYQNSTYIIKEYGPMHLSYSILIGVFDLSLAAVVLYAVHKPRDFSHKNAMIVFLMLLNYYVFYTLERRLGWRVEILPIVFLVDEIVFILLFKRSEVYDLDLIANASENKVEKNAYIVFDRKCRYLGCNQVAKQIFPELKEYKIDRKILETETALDREVLSWLNEYSMAEEVSLRLLPPPRTIVINRVIYKCKLHFICKKRNDALIGYYFEISDYSKEKADREALVDYNDLLKQEVSAKTAYLQDVQKNMLIAVIDAAENRDGIDGEHIKRTSAAYEVFLKELIKHPGIVQISDSFADSLSRASVYYDYGKIFVEKSIIHKKEKLTTEEMQEMKRHSVYGSEAVTRMLDTVENRTLRIVAKNMTLYHHEWWNGTGYPEGLRGSDIPLEARTMAFIDVLDALVAPRCYKSPVEFDAAIEIIKNASGTQFDPILSRLFMECVPALKELYGTFNIEGL